MSKPAEKVEAFVRARVSHPRQIETLERVWAEIELARHNPTVIILAGPTGVGKTNLIERLEVDALQRFKSETDKNGRIPFLSVDATPPQFADFRFPAFFNQILQAADEGHIGGTPRSRSNSDELQLAALNVLRYRKPIVFCVDEAQHLTYATKPDKLKRHLDVIKSLAVQSHAPILLVGTYDLVPFTRLSGQLGRRTVPITFEPYRYMPEDLRQFRRVITSFGGQLPVRLSFEPLDKKNVDMFFRGSAGSVGILKVWFTKALGRCLCAGRSALTLDDLEKSQLDFGKLEQIAHENLEGCREIQAIKGSASRVEQMLGMTVPAPSAPAAPPAGPTLRPGQRRLQRDRTGFAA